MAFLSTFWILSTTQGSVEKEDDDNQDTHSLYLTFFFVQLGKERIINTKEIIKHISY